MTPQHVWHENAIQERIMFNSSTSFYPSCLRAHQSCFTEADGFLFILRCIFSQKPLWPQLKSSAASCKTGRTNNLWKQPNRLGMQGYSPLELPNMVVKTPVFFWSFNLSQENNDLQIALTTLNMICLLSGFKVDSFPLPKQQTATGVSDFGVSKEPSETFWSAAKREEQKDFPNA